MEDLSPQYRLGGVALGIRRSGNRHRCGIPSWFAVEVDAGTPDACRDKSFQPKIVEVNNKENDEIGVGVIAVAVDGFVSERLPIVPHFLFDGLKRSVEFVVLRAFCVRKMRVCHG